jgi:hypothetical protein
MQLEMTKWLTRTTEVLSQMENGSDGMVGALLAAEPSSLLLGTTTTI